MAGANTLTITQDNFEETVLRAEGPVLVDFWASWCPPCRMLGPTIDTIADERSGVNRVGKVDVDDNKELAARFGISSIPTVLIFMNGEVVKTFVGLQGREAYIDALDEAAAAAV